VTFWPRVVAAVCVNGLGIAWLLYAGMKAHHGIGEGTLYAAWIGGHGWLHWGWCGSEAGLGLWLLSGRAVRSALLVSMFLVTMFSAVIVLEPRLKPCGCGMQRQLANRAEAVQDVQWSLGRNALLVALAVVAVAALSMTPPQPTGPVHPS
jgi:hypothetical protein